MSGIILGFLLAWNQGLVPKLYYDDITTIFVDSYKTFLTTNFVPVELPRLA